VKNDESLHEEPFRTGSRANPAPSKPDSGVGRAEDIRGVGIGLRAPHYRPLAERPLAERSSSEPSAAEPAEPSDAGLPRPDFLEVMADNYLQDGGPPLHWLDLLSERYPCVVHSVGLSLGSSDPLDVAQIDRVAAVAKRCSAAWVSDHLSWSHLDGQHFHDLWPLPQTEEAVAHVAARIERVRDRLGVPFLIENLSAYATFEESALEEWDFLAAVAERADCGILLDVNNIAVSAHNLGLDPDCYLAGIPIERVREIHLAGYEERGGLWLDTHGARVHEHVWELYARALQRFGPIPTLIEWDRDIPELDVLLAEAKRAQALMQAASRAA